jgi:hypothetical protein
MKEVKAPNSYNIDGMVSVFLAGSIEMNTAERWQLRLVESLSDMTSLLILNPRRENWDSSLKQTKDEPQFRDQVVWELQAQETVDVIAMYFDPATKSPITLLELGLFADKHMVVFCPDGYFRKGNVDITCERYGIEQADSWDDFVAKVRAALKKAEDRRLEGAWK